LFESPTVHMAEFAADGLASSRTASRMLSRRSNPVAVSSRCQAILRRVRGK
jgi:hypothetical protein